MVIGTSRPVHECQIEDQTNAQKRIGLLDAFAVDRPLGVAPVTVMRDVSEREQ
jgi:hypothetical protein